MAEMMATKSEVRQESVQERPFDAMTVRTVRSWCNPRGASTRFTKAMVCMTAGSVSLPLLMISTGKVDILSAGRWHSLLRG